MSYYLPPKKAKTSTVAENTNDPDIQSLAQNLPTFELQPIDQIDTIDYQLLANIIYDIPTENDDKQKKDTDTNKQVNVHNVLEVIPQNSNMQV